MRLLEAQDQSTHPFCRELSKTTLEPAATGAEVAPVPGLVVDGVEVWGDAVEEVPAVDARTFFTIEPTAVGVPLQSSIIAGKEHPPGNQAQATQ